MPLFPSWTRILSPSDLKDRWSDRTPTVYCACLRGRKVPRLCGTDDMGILFLGYCVHRKRTLREFVRCSTKGTKGLHDGPIFKGRLSQRHKTFPNTGKACGEVLSIPVQPQITKNDIECIIEAIRSFFKK